ncbi:2'-5' RNA ligase [Gammaproteobacteria bacterium]|nr:2'-5' RNA ligase [Gammaproteobacteria bacterium]
MTQNSIKYNRTFHYPFSLGTSSDDRINAAYWQDFGNIPELIHTEKLDGENNCLSRHGVFARSHATPTQSAWTQHLRVLWQSLRNDLGDLEIFIENLFAIHSIHYKNINDYYYVFAVRQNGRFLSWDDVKEIAALFGFPTVPEISIPKFDPKSEPEFKRSFLSQISSVGSFDPYDIHTQMPCTIEGIVSRNRAAFSTDDFAHNVFKYVRKNHVKTNQHWRKNWQRAELKSIT